MEKGGGNGGNFQFLARGETYVYLKKTNKQTKKLTPE